MPEPKKGTGRFSHTFDHGVIHNRKAVPPFSFLPLSPPRLREGGSEGKLQKGGYHETICMDVGIVDGVTAVGVIGVGRASVGISIGE